MSILTLNWHREGVSRFVRQPGNQVARKIWIKSRKPRDKHNLVQFSTLKKKETEKYCNLFVYHTTTSVKSGKPQQANNKLISNIPTPDQAYVPNLNRISKSILDIYLFISVCYNKNYISIL